jgi:hypothetical protein
MSNLTTFGRSYDYPIQYTPYDNGATPNIATYYKQSQYPLCNDGAIVAPVPVSIKPTCFAFLKPHTYVEPSVPRGNLMKGTIYLGDGEYKTYKTTPYKCCNLNL